MSMMEKADNTVVMDRYMFAVNYPAINVMNDAV